MTDSIPIKEKTRVSFSCNLIENSPFVFVVTPLLDPFTRTVTPGRGCLFSSKTSPVKIFFSGSAIFGGNHDDVILESVREFRGTQYFFHDFLNTFICDEMVRSPDLFTLIGVENEAITCLFLNLGEKFLACSVLEVQRDFFLLRVAGG